MLVVGGSSGDSCAAPSLAFTWEMENGVLWPPLLWMELGASPTLHVLQVSVCLQNIAKLQESNRKRLVIVAF